MEDNCPFCSLRIKNIPDIPESLQVPGYENLNQNLLYNGDHLIVKPDISPVIKNHFLIIPKEHYFSFSSLPLEYSDELDSIKRKIIRFYKKDNSIGTIFFEHGCCDTEKGSSCVKHAHLHAIPVDFDLEREIIKRSINILGCPLKDKSHITSDTYLYLESTNSYHMYWNDTEKKSQFFRFIISDIIGEFRRSRWQNCILDENERLKSELWLNGLRSILL